MFGWIGTILRVDLSSGKISKEALDPNLAKMYIGARGLGARIISNEVDPAADPLGPANKLIFAAGPLTGTYAPSCGRYDVVTKGPLNGTIAGSNSGGSFGPELKYAGYDLIIIEGKAAKPSYIWIDDGKVEIRSAEHLWGKIVPDVTDAVRAETDEEAKVACIGPAGENQVLFACVMNEMNRAAGRTGVGSVMGSKNLKAVAVSGSGSVAAADPDAFKQAVMKARKKIQEHPVGGQGLKAYGTEVLVNILNNVGCLPTRNFREGTFATADKVGGEALAANNLIRAKGCFSCIISCGRVTRVTDPKYESYGEGPEYETGWSFGPACGVDNLDAILKANYLCNELGLDTITMGSTIACAMDLFADGIMTLKDTDGKPLEFGDADAVVELTKKTAYKEGLGAKLALGSYRLAESFGHPEYSMTTKKQEMPAYDPRGIMGIGLHYATGNRGGDHVRGYTISVEVLGSPFKVDQYATKGKAEIVKTFQNLTAALDSSGACLFSTFGIGADELAEMLSALTGVPYSTDEFMKAGERIWNMERLWNLKIGLSAKDDTLPERLLKDPIPAGPSKGKVNLLGKMLPEYYEVRGWDKNGVPTAAKLKELGLTTA